MSIATPTWVVLCLAGSLFGVEAVALLHAGPAVVSLVLYSQRLAKLIGFSPKHLVHATSKSAGVALIVASTALLVLHVEVILSRPAFVQLASGASLSALVWLASCFAVRHLIILEIQALPARISNRLRKPARQ